MSTATPALRTKSAHTTPLNFRQWLALAALTLPVLIIAIDSTVLGFAVPALSADLKPSSTQLLWIVDIYSFILAGLLITMGTLGDRIGRRKLLLIGATGFGVTSAIAAFAPSAELLIAARALMGISGATLMPSTLSLIRNVFTDRQQRRLAIAVWAAAASGGAALGPIVGGLLLNHFSWGSVFLINLPIMVVLLILAPFVVPESRTSNPGKYDLLSVALTLGSILPFVYGIKRLSHDGFDVVTAACLIAGIAIGIWFVRRQLWLSSPMIDVSLFTNRVFSTAVCVNLLSVFALVSSLFFATQYLQGVLGLDALTSALWLLPAMAASVIMSLVAVLIARKFSLAVSISAGMFLATIGYVLMVFLGSGHDVAVVGGGLLLIGAGIGLAETLTNDAIMSAVPANRAGAASAISETAYEMGAALGVAIMGSIMAASYASRLRFPQGTPDDVRQAAHETLGAGLSAAETLPSRLGDAVIDAVSSAFTSAIHVTSAIAAVIVLAGAIGSLVVLGSHKARALAERD
ncbi:MFS transporter [Saxibacter everestensis]|uniref:MFS transporter n=1 Tax=Saxibacter everestensis TaxID=2909229 RepID=A0ABY8QRL8_9MICO|nr:MFS transporter [Brevibacteriaceae bacterium ZFBP1038]